MVVFDNTFLSLLLYEHASAPIDPATGKPVDRAAERIDVLVRQLHRQGAKVLVPTPALAELLVVAGSAGPAFLLAIADIAAMQVVDFDTKAAVECAAIARSHPGTGGSRQKIKVDRQILAIALVHGATALYTDDEALAKLAIACGLEAHSVADLPLPPPTTPPLPFGGPDTDDAEPDRTNEDQ